MCPFYQYKLKKIKATRGPRFLSEDVSGPLNKNSSKEISTRSIEPHGTHACARVTMNVLPCNEER